VKFDFDGTFVWQNTHPHDGIHETGGHREVVILDTDSENVAGPFKVRQRFSRVTFDPLQQRRCNRIVVYRVAISSELRSVNPPY